MPTRTAIQRVSELRTLSFTEYELLQQCEARIKRALVDMRAAGIECGLAISEIHAKKLWRDKAENFNAYLEAEWHPIPRSTIYEWMKAAGVVTAFEQHPVIVDGVCKVIEPPAKIKHAQALAELPPHMQPEAFRNAQERAKSENRTVTTYDIKRAVSAILCVPEPTSDAHLKHEREQKAFCDQVMRLWAKIEPARRHDLLAKLQAGLKDESKSGDEQ